MTKEEAIIRIRDHMTVHLLHEPRAILITEALNMAISALEKQISKKPNLDIGYDGEGNAWNNWNCPCCRKSYLLDDEEYNYCPECGQRIDWAEGEEE